MNTQSTASAVMIAASHPLHVFNNTPAPFGFSHCQKLIGPPFSSVCDTCLLGGEQAPVLTQRWPRMGQTERPTTHKTHPRPSLSSHFRQRLVEYAWGDANGRFAVWPIGLRNVYGKQSSVSRLGALRLL